MHSILNNFQCCTGPSFTNFAFMCRFGAAIVTEGAIPSIFHQLPNNTLCFLQHPTVASLPSQLVGRNVSETLISLSLSLSLSLSVSLSLFLSLSLVLVLRTSLSLFHSIFSPIRNSFLSPGWLSPPSRPCAARGLEKYG